MDVQQLGEGLWRWTAPHPEWNPGDDWDRDVGCVYAETPEAVVLIDPLLPAADDRERFWEALDRDVSRLGRPVVVLLTCEWHGRSADEVAARYGASRPGPGEPLPAGVEGVAVPAVEETVFVLPEYRAVVTGDIVIGDGQGGVRLMPDSWFEGRWTPGEARVELRRLLERPIELVLVSHGEPVLTGGREALAGALS
jgi:glyoxylase-like metal-dependent hydrolase (beta-lactamase superfamily II)